MVAYAFAISRGLTALTPSVIDGTTLSGLAIPRTWAVSAILAGPTIEANRAYAQFTEYAMASVRVSQPKCSPSKLPGIHGSGAPLGFGIEQGVVPSIMSTGEYPSLSAAMRVNGLNDEPA